MRNPTANKSRKASAPRKVATVALPILTGADAPVLPAEFGPRVSFTLGSPGRPESGTADTIARGFDILAHFVALMPTPVLTVAPRGLSPRMRAAVAADNADELRAYAFVKMAVANGRARNNGR